MWTFPKVLAHRGGGTLAPENTIAGLRCGLQYGYLAVEFDVMLTRDHVPVLIHDPQFGRTVQGAGSVAWTDASDLLRMDAGSWFSSRFAGETVPSFASAVNFCQAHDIWMNIEIKPAPGFDEPTGRIVAEFAWRAFSHRPSDQWPLLSSFSMTALHAAMKAAPDLPRAVLLDRIDDNWQALAQQYQVVAVHTNQKHLTLRRAQEIRQAGLGLFCYTVNDTVRADELLAMGVDAFCTDRIDLIGPAYPL